MANKSFENEILYDFTLGDLQYESLYYMGRELNEIELKKAKKLLQNSVEVARVMIFSFVFDTLKDK